jgi:hypothetical protein
MSSIVRFAPSALLLTLVACGGSSATQPRDTVFVEKALLAPSATSAILQHGDGVYAVQLAYRPWYWPFGLRWVTVGFMAISNGMSEEPGEQQDTAYWILSSELMEKYDGDRRLPFSTEGSNGVSLVKRRGLDDLERNLSNLIAKELQGYEDFSVDRVNSAVSVCRRADDQTNYDYVGDCLRQPSRSRPEHSGFQHGDGVYRIELADNDSDKFDWKLVGFMATRISVENGVTRESSDWVLSPTRLGEISNEFVANLPLPERRMRWEWVERDPNHEQILIKLGSSDNDRIVVSRVESTRCLVGDEFSDSDAVRHVVAGTECRTAAAPLAPAGGGSGSGEASPGSGAPQ